MKKILLLIILLLISHRESRAQILLDFNHFNSRLYGSAESMLVQKDDHNNMEVFPASLAGIKGNALSAGYIRWLDLIKIMRIGYGHSFGEKTENRLKSKR